MADNVEQGLTSPRPEPSSSSYPPRSALERLATSRKGKNKSIDYASDYKQALESPNGMSFAIRFTEGEQDIPDLWVDDQATVRQVKERLRILRPNLMVDGKPRRLRLIQLGRLLTDGTKLVPYTSSLLAHRAKLQKGQGEMLMEGAYEGFQAMKREIGTVLREESEDVKGKGKAKPIDAEPERNEKVWIQCSIGEVMNDEPELEQEEVELQTKPLRGFDRLMETGFSAEDVARMREQFRGTISSSPAPPGTDEDEHARSLEDQWMEGLTSQDENNEVLTAHVWVTMVQGICLGFFLPFLPLFFFKTALFSKHMQMAIVFGIGINLIFGALRSFA